MGDTYINLGTKFLLNRAEKELKNLETGEIHTESDEVERILEQLKNDKKFNRDMERGVRETFGLPTALEVFHQKWKGDSWFIKIYRTERREFLKDAKLSVNASALLLHMEGYLEYKTNRVANKDGKRFTNKDLQTLVGLSPTTLKKVLNELEGKSIIKRTGSSQSREIYINPYFMCAGNILLKDVDNLFKDYIPITPY